MKGPALPVEKKFEINILKKIFKKKFRFLLAYNTPRQPQIVQKNVSPFGPVVWPAIGNINIYECLFLLYKIGFRGRLVSISHFNS